MRREEARALTIKKRELIFKNCVKTIESMIMNCIEDGKFERVLFSYTKEIDTSLENHFKELGYDIYIKKDKKYISWL